MERCLSGVCGIGRGWGWNVVCLVFVELGGVGWNVVRLVFVELGGGGVERPVNQDVWGFFSRPVKQAFKKKIYILAVNQVVFYAQSNRTFYILLFFYAQSPRTVVFYAQSTRMVISGSARYRHKIVTSASAGNHAALDTVATERETPPRDRERELRARNISREGEVDANCHCTDFCVLFTCVSQSGFLLFVPLGGSVFCCGKRNQSVCWRLPSSSSVLCSVN